MSKNKTGNGLKIIIIVLALLLVIAVGVIAVLLINNDKDNISDKDGDKIVTEAEEEEKDPEDEDNKKDKDEEKTDSVFEDIFSKDVEKSELQFFYNEKEEKTYLILNGEVLEDTVDGKISTTSSDYIPSKSLRNDVFFFGNYAVKDKKLYKFADDIDNISLNDRKFSLNIAYSNDGEGVAYINEAGELVLYQFKNNETIKISDEEVTTFAVSPDAKTVLYAIREDARISLYLYKDGENKKIDEGFQNRAKVVAVSNNGDNCYIYDWCNEPEGNPLYHYNGDGDKTVLYKHDPAKTQKQHISNISLNIDNTQLSGCAISENYLFVYDGLKDEKTKYDVKYNEEYAVDLTPLSPYWLYDFKAFSRSTSADTLYFERVIFTSVENLNDCYFMSALRNYYPFYINGDKIKEFEITKPDTIISDENDKIVFKDRDKNELYFASLDDNNPNKIAEKVVGFGVTSDFKHVFYITEDEELYVVNSDGSEKKKLDENVSNECYSSGLDFVGWFGPRIIGEDYIIYGTNDEEVYLCDTKGKKAKIDGTFDPCDINRAEDVGSLYGRIAIYNYMMVFPNRSFITYINNGNLYKIDSNGKTSLLLENVE